MESATGHEEGPGTAELNEVQAAAATLALSRWADFPVSAGVRPIVLLGGPILCRGFSTGVAKGAYMMGLVEADPGVPDEPVQRLRQIRQLEPIDGVPPLRLLRARPTVAQYASDRGPMELSAWRVEAVDAIEPIWVLSDGGRQQCWSSPSEPDEGWPHAGYPVWAGVVDPDGLELSVDFTGGVHPVFHYELITLESETAVVVVPISLPSLEGGRGFVPARGDAHHGRVRLNRPLGARVVVNLDASPVSVTGGREAADPAP